MSLPKFARGMRLTAEQARSVPRLLLYRRMLKSARHYPSIKRPEIIQEIKTAFREHSNETDDDELVAHVEHGLNALRLLNQYAHLDPRKSHWELNLD